MISIWFALGAWGNFIFGGGTAIGLAYAFGATGQFIVCQLVKRLEAMK